jgi:hypothetical protein
MGWPGEQLIIRLWETLAEKGIGSLLKPWQIKREGLAHIEVRRVELLALAQTEKDAEDIHTGRKSLEDFSPDLKFGPGVLTPLPQKKHAQSPIDLQMVVEISARRIIEDSIRREVNVAKAIVHAEEDLRDDAQEPPEQKIDNDWLYRWRDYAGDISADEMQLLWGRLLAGELKSPGSYSLRCLDFLRNLSQSEAQKIERLSRFVLEDAVWRDNNSPLESEGITFRFLFEMQDLGVVSGVEALGLERTWKTTASDKFITPLRSNGKVLIVRNEDPDKLIKLKIYLLTSVGQQILRLGKFEPHLEYLRKIGNVIHDQGFSVTLGDYVQTSDKTIRYFNEVLIEASQGAQVDRPAADGTAA